MQWLASVCIRQPVLTWVLMLTTIVVGALDELRSTSSDGVSMVAIAFTLDKDIELATPVAYPYFDDLVHWRRRKQASARVDRGEREIAQPERPMHVIEQAN